MITPHERELIDAIYEKEMDFYAPLLFLTLARYNARVTDTEFADKMSETQIKDLVMEVYADLQEAGQ
jgi:hypothetical protein